MRIDIPCSVLGLALIALAPTAQAQVLAPQPAVTVPPATMVVTPTVRTVRTVTTVRTVRPLAARRVAVTRRTVRTLAHRRVAVTRRTYVRERVLPSTTTTTTTTVASAPAVAAAYPPPVYDYVRPAPAALPAPYYTEPLYDAAVQTPAVAPAPAAAAVPVYRYVYQPGRILVIDPETGIAVQAIPR